MSNLKLSLVGVHAVVLLNNFWIINFRCEHGGKKYGDGGMYFQHIIQEVYIKYAHFLTVMQTHVLMPFSAIDRFSTVVE